MSDTNDVADQWSRMMENMNDAMARSLEQNMETQARFVEAWGDAVEDSMPEEDQLGESLESYNAAYGVWMDAADRMFERMRDAAEGEDVAITELRDIWLQSANEAFKEVMGTSAFAAATGDFVEEMTAFQEELQEYSQDSLAQMGLPTREDVDEVGERLVELERRQHEVESKLDRIVEQLEE